MHWRPILAVSFLSALACPVLADGPADNIPDKVRRIPPPGIEVSEADEVELREGLQVLAQAMADVAAHPLLPDVEIYHKAVRYALDYDEFQKPPELKWAREQLAEGMKRAASLKAGDAPWAREAGLVVRGYRSRIDGSAQPYGLVIPESYQFDGAHRHRLDFWFHGRGERTNEIAFIHTRMTNRGQYTPDNTIVLHPYARYSNANKFAGEIDCLEALEHVKTGYRIDLDRVLVRGFSMGGAACWQLAALYADRWCAANPGAGFSETSEFLKFFQGETLDPSPFERKLWQLYDCTGYAPNFFNLPLVAYSGEKDRQKQAADIMATALAREGITLRHIIGPDTGHKIHPDSKLEIESRLDAIAARGRLYPDAIKLVTYSLRYNRMHWFRIDQLGEHWKQARVDAEIATDRIRIDRIENVTAFTISFPAGRCPLDPTKPGQVEIGGKRVAAAAPIFSDRSWEASFALVDGSWEATSGTPVGLRKRHGLQGPIDDAFMDSFLFVAPNGVGEGAFGQWERAERRRAVTHWRQQFRGDARVKLSVDLTDEDVMNHNLVLWGDPSTNAVIAKVADTLPIRWDAEAITVGDRRFDAKTHALTLIYPNPRNAERYIVINSSFTYREYDYLNNARQVAKLPDWAVVDLSEPPGTQRPGAIAAAGFFDERWELK